MCRRRDGGGAGVCSSPFNSWIHYPKCWLWYPWCNYLEQCLVHNILKYSSCFSCQNSSLIPSLRLTSFCWPESMFEFWNDAKYRVTYNLHIFSPRNFGSTMPLFIFKNFLHHISFRNRYLWVTNPLVFVVGGVGRGVRGVWMISKWTPWSLTGILKNLKRTHHSYPT